VSTGSREHRAALLYNNLPCRDNKNPWQAHLRLGGWAMPPCAHASWVSFGWAGWAWVSTMELVSWRMQASYPPAPNV